MTTDPDALALVKLHAAGRRFARAQTTRDTAHAELLDAIGAPAQVPAVSRTALVDIFGVPRQTVFDALRQQPATHAGTTP